MSTFRSTTCPIVTDFWRRVSADGVLDDVAAGIEDDVDQG